VIKIIHGLIFSFKKFLEQSCYYDYEVKIGKVLLPKILQLASFEHIQFKPNNHQQIQLLAEHFNSDMKMKTVDYKNDDEMDSPPTPSNTRNHYYRGSPQSNSLFFHDRSPISPSSVFKILVDTKSSSHHKKSGLSFESTLPTTGTLEEAASPLVMGQGRQRPTQQAERSSNHQAPPVTPNASFAEIDFQESNQKSQPRMTLVTLGNPSGQLSSWSSPASPKLASVGLPSLYPANPRSNTLEETVLEELYDFDEFFEQPCNSIPAMKSSDALGDVSHTENRMQRLDLTSPVPDDDDHISAASPSKKLENTPPSSPRRRRHRTRSRNKAMDQNFFKSVMNEIYA
jgi:hypothetical protein